MPDTVISVESLSKSYVVGHQSAPRKAVDLVRGRQIVQGDEVEEFWALKDVSFEVKRGEVLGIIGCNGAGKSTLLKVLSRITEPTRGRIKIRGQVASLLEVGTGFHPELIGRENNGAVLRMKRAEIKQQFDEIVAFAEVERFLDTPVKHYSSGMYVRLAFAVAAHLEPEILIMELVGLIDDVRESAQSWKELLLDLKRRGLGSKTLVWCSHVLEHIPDDRKALSAIFRVLAPGGLLVLQVPIQGDTTFEGAADVSEADRLEKFLQGGTPSRLSTMIVRLSASAYKPK